MNKKMCKPCFTQIAVLFLLLSSARNLYAQPDKRLTHSFEHYSDSMQLSKIYQSMRGPYRNEKISPIGAEKPELIWLTGARVEVVQPQSNLPAPPEYLCHQQLYFDFDAFSEKNSMEFGNVMRKNLLLFRLGQGQLEMKFPENFGIPLNSKEFLYSDVMAMNPKAVEEPVYVSFKTTLDYAKDSELKDKIKPLFLLLGAVWVPIREERGDDTAGELLKSASRTTIIKSSDGKPVSSHWLVPPGRHIYKYNITREISEGLPFDSSVHYIGVHMHPFAESLELIDLTSGKSLFKSEAENYPDRAAVKNLGHFSSKRGFKISASHEYEMVAVYNNTSDKIINAMAVMYMYVLDKSFDKKSIALHSAGTPN